MFSHGLGWILANTIKQLVTSTSTAVSPCSDALLRFDCCFQLQSQGVFLIRVGTAQCFSWWKQFHMNRKMAPRSQMEEYWVFRRLHAREWGISAETPTLFPSGLNKTWKTEYQKQIRVSAVAWVCLEAHLRESMQHGDIQHAVSCFIPFYSLREICMSTKAGPDH